MNKFLSLILLTGVFWTDQILAMYRGREARLSQALTWADQQAEIVDLRIKSMILQKKPDGFEDQEFDFEEQISLDYKIIAFRLQRTVFKITGKVVGTSFNERLEVRCSSPHAVWQNFSSPSFLPSPESSPNSFFSLPVKNYSVAAKKACDEIRDEVREFVKQRETDIIVPDLHSKIIYFHIKKSLNEEIVSFDCNKKG